MFLSILCGVVVMILGPARQWGAPWESWLFEKKVGAVLHKSLAKRGSSPKWLAGLYFDEGKTGFEPSMAFEFCTLAKGKRGSSAGCFRSFAFLRGEGRVRALGSLRD